MSLVVLLENIRSAHNVGAIWRTAEASGVERIILIGQTPSPLFDGDTRPPYVADRAAKLIAKTALGAQFIVPFEYYSDVATAITQLQHNNYKIAALELADHAINLFTYQTPPKLALIIGHETLGISEEIQLKCDVVLQIPMTGLKESLNVSVATGIALYQLRFGRAVI